MIRPVQYVDAEQHWLCMVGKGTVLHFWEVPLQSPTLHRGTCLQQADCTGQTFVPAWLSVISEPGNQAHQQIISYPALFPIFHNVLLYYPPTLK